MDDNVETEIPKPAEVHFAIDITEETISTPRSAGAIGELPSSEASDIPSSFAESSKNYEDYAEYVGEEINEGYGVTQMATDILYDIIQETIKRSEAEPIYVKLNEHDQLTAFIEDTLGALADDIEMGERQYIPHDEVYFWSTYFFLQFCGFRIFLANIDDIIRHGRSVNEVAEILVELVDTVAENAPYLHLDSDLPEHICKNIIWQMLNSRMMKRRYNDKGVAFWQAEDILDELLEKVFEIPSPPPQEPPRSPPEPKKRGTSAELVEDPAICREFAGIYNVAEYFVSNILLESAEFAISTKAQLENQPGKKVRIDEVAHHELTPDAIIHSILRTLPKRHGLPSIEKFNIKLGKRAIFDMIGFWKRTLLSEEWMYAVKFLIGQSDACSDYYIYEAKFGLPTELYPVPQATCSLLFKIEVSRVKPPVCPVNISFKIEGSGYVHTPDEYLFQESWLLNVIKAKIKLFSSVEF